MVGYRARWPGNKCDGRHVTKLAVSGGVPLPVSVMVALDEMQIEGSGEIAVTRLLWRAQYRDSCFDRIFHAVPAPDKLSIGHLAKTRAGIYGRSLFLPTASHPQLPGPG